MRLKAGVALAALLLAGGCDSAPRCPVPVTYNDAQLKDIQKSLSALPKDSILRSVMVDYENERDDLRFCK